MAFTNQAFKSKHMGYDLFMTSEQLSKIASEKKGMILNGSFSEDLTLSAIALAQSLPEFKEDIPLFSHHWGYLNKLTEDQLTEVVLPFIKVKLNNILRDFNSMNKSRLIEFAKAYECCSTRLLALKASK
jgi:hypothetical protein